jgi:hypothetical protein
VATFIETFAILYFLRSLRSFAAIPSVFLGSSPHRREQGLVAGDAGEGGIELEALTHGGYGAGEEIHVATGIVAAQGRFRKAEAGFHVIERVA